jgi:hypothetical protein
MVKRYTLKRVGAASGAAIFECKHLLGKDVTVVDAADYDALEEELDALKEESAEEGRMITGFVNRIVLLQNQYLEVAQERDRLSAALAAK